MDHTKVYVTAWLVNDFLPHTAFKIHTRISHGFKIKHIALAQLVKCACDLVLENRETNTQYQSHHE